MGLFDKFMDRFNKAEFTIAPNKKLKSLSKEFKEAYDLSLVFYKGKMIAEEELTLGALNQKTSADIATTSKEGIKIKGNMLVKDVEKSFRKEIEADEEEAKRKNIDEEAKSTKLHKQEG
jgi:uncharacterized protein